MHALRFLTENNFFKAADLQVVMWNDFKDILSKKKQGRNIECDPFTCLKRACVSVCKPRIVSCSCKHSYVWSVIILHTVCEQVWKHTHTKSSTVRETPSLSRDRRFTKNKRREGWVNSNSLLVLHISTVYIFTHLYSCICLNFHE